MQNKRGQFFLIMAVLIGALLLGATALFNTSKTSTTALNQFELTCENYYYEAQELHKNCIIKEENFKEKLEEFTEEFLKDKEVELVYFYGNENEIQNCICDKNSCKCVINSPLTSSTTEGRTFEFKPYNTFQFVMKQEKGGEIFYCEK